MPSEKNSFRTGISIPEDYDNPTERIRPAACIKFCGGCNSRYNRSEAVSQLKAQLPEYDITYAEDGRTYDYIIAVSGCMAACPDCSSLTATKGRIDIRCRQEVIAAVEYLTNAL